MPDDSLKVDVSTNPEHLRFNGPQSSQTLGSHHQNGGALFHNGINGSKHLNGHQSSSETQNGMILIPNNRTTRSKPSQHVIAPVPVIQVPAKPKPRRVEDDNLKPVLASQATFTQQLLASTEEIDFQQYVAKCLEEAKAQSAQSTLSQRGEASRSNIDALTFAADRPRRDDRDLEQAEALDDRIDIPNIQKRLKANNEVSRGRDSFDLVLQPSNSMVVEESLGLDQSYPEKDIPLLRAMSENNKNSAVHLEYPHSPLFKSGLNGANRSSGFKLVQSGPKPQSRPPSMPSGSLVGSSNMLNGPLVSGIGPYYNQNSPGQLFIPMGQYAGGMTAQIYSFAPGVPYMKTDLNRMSLHNSNSKTRPVAIIPHDDELNLNQNERNP